MAMETNAFSNSSILSSEAIQTGFQLRWISTLKSILFQESKTIAGFLKTE
jgi:hypothetical protein